MSPPPTAKPPSRALVLALVLVFLVATLTLCTPGLLAGLGVAP